MIYLLDTTAFSDLMRRDAKTQIRLNTLHSNDQVFVSSIVRGEIQYGLHRLPNGKRRRNLEAEADYLFANIPCITVTETAADLYASTKRQAERRDTPLDENDLWIAATALELAATLVTTDSNFGRLRSLRVEDWSR